MTLDVSEDVSGSAQQFPFAPAWPRRASEFGAREAPQGAINDGMVDAFELDSHVRVAPADGLPPAETGARPGRLRIPMRRQSGRGGWWQRSSSISGSCSPASGLP
jgi:hypothetical protein